MSDYIKVAKLSDIPLDSGKRVDVDGTEIALFKDRGEVCALYNLCPHAGGPLAEGGVRDGHAICPWHGWEFDLRTGASSFNDTLKTPVFKVRVEGEDVFVKLSSV